MVSGGTSDSTADTAPLVAFRYVAAVALCLVGIVFVASLPVVTAALGPGTVVAEQFDPETEPNEAAVATEVVDLDRRAENGPDEVGDAFDAAAEEGVYESDDDPPLALSLVADDDGQYEFAVYEGDYYRWESAVEDERVRIELEPVDAETVMDAVATPYEEADPETRRVVDEGAVEYDVGDDRPTTGVVERDGTYYAISAENVLGAVVGRFVRPLFAALQVVGATCLAAGGWLLWRLRAGGPRPLTTGDGAKIAGIAAVVAAALALHASAPPPVALGVRPALAAAAVAFVVAGLLLKERRWLRLVAVLVGAPIAVLVVAALAHAIDSALAADETLVASLEGALGGVLAAITAVVVAGAVGWPLVAYGYWFAADASDDESERSSTETAPART